MGLTALWWWIDRWRKSTAYTDMTLAEQGAYRNLLDEAQLRGGPLPNDEHVLAKACGDPRAWNRVRTKVMQHFTLKPDGWRNDTLDEVLKESLRLANKQARYRARKGNARGNEGGNAGGHVTGNGGVTKGGYPSPSPDTKNDDDVPPRRVSGLSRGLLKPHGNVAFDSPRVHVPWKLHFEFLGLRNNSNAEAELQTFYQQTSEAWTTGPHAADNVDPEMFRFWRARYAEQWPPAKPDSPRVKSADELQMDANKAKYVPPSRRLQ